MATIELKNIRKSYGDLVVLDDLNLVINHGELVTLLGPSGCGKSTLLRSVAGLESIDNGAVLVDGENITHTAARDRGVGMVFQQYSLFPTMNVIENIDYGLKIKRIPAKERKTRVEEAIHLVGLNGKEKHMPGELSGGQRQRVALARAIVTRPKMLLLDEPLSAIDAKLRKSLQQSIRSIQKQVGITTIFVTHDQDEAMVLSDRVVILNNGRIEQESSPIDIYIHPRTSFVAGFMGNYNLLSPDQFRQLVGVMTKNQIAIRPETITLEKGYTEMHNAYSLRGKVLEMTPLGNILSYQIECNGIRLRSDQLFRSHALFEIGETVHMNIEKHNCLSV